MINQGIIPGSTDAINNALARRGLGMQSGQLDQVSGGPTQGMTPGVSGGPQTPPPTQPAPQNKPPVQPDEKMVIVQALASRLKQLGAQEAPPKPMSVPPVPGPPTM